MDQPLFGEREKKTTALIYVVGTTLTIFVLFSATIGVIFGIERKAEHFVLVILMVLLFLTLAITYKCFSDGEFDPKLRWIIILLTIVVFIAGVAVNIYAWEPLPEPPPKIECAGLYRTSDGVCFLGAAGCWDKPGYCVSISGHLASCTSNRNCPTTTGSVSTSSSSGFDYYSPQSYSQENQHNQQRE